MLLVEVVGPAESVLVTTTGPDLMRFLQERTIAIQLRDRAVLTMIDVRNARNYSRVTLRTNCPL